MKLTAEEQDMLQGAYGRAVQKAMQILVALGTIYEAEAMVAVSSVQVAGVSYDNLGEAGLEFLEEMAGGGGKVRVLTTLNPAGMDIENWQAMGIDPVFAAQQQRVIDAFTRMGIIPTCSCTPYLFGNTPLFGEHIAWSESSAVCYANSVLGARSNREGGPSALAAAITGRTPCYGFHLEQKRYPTITFDIKVPISGTYAFGVLGKVVGDWMESCSPKPVPYLMGVSSASLEELKSLSASIATYGGAALFHIPGVTPEASCFSPPEEKIVITRDDLARAAESLNDVGEEQVDFISLGCPHLSLREVARIAELLAGRRVRKTFWITTSRPVKRIADSMGYTRVIEEAGAIFAVDTCCVVAPIKGRFRALATDSAKACFYATAKNGFKTRLLPFDRVVEEALL
ncbi:MAG: DUF521 domain-containing protein [Anaerolineae bacterium]|nr:DUF521 domain-containing protein [Anaerolineae bacterium]